MGGTIGVKFGKNFRKQHAAVSTTSEKILVGESSGVRINRCESAIESIKCIKYTT